jgi:3-deoxy-manno-octulosonate cytidylyltransferase (CMP-KDO synthetase)
VNAIAVIPARYASTRLPGKMLLCRTGKPLIQHVVESIRPARRVNRIIVATDDKRIADAVKAFGGEAVMTDPQARCGTDRVAEVAEQLRLGDEAMMINVQGDEPEMPAACVDKLVELLQSTEAPMATLATPISAAEGGLLNMTKVVLDRNGAAMYFSRARIPHDRDGDGQVRYLLHHGIYGYRAGFLRIFTSLESTPAEQAEKLEQLRALEHGYKIAVGIVDYRGARIDTPEEYEQFVARATK